MTTECNANAAALRAKSGANRDRDELKNIMEGKTVEKEVERTTVSNERIGAETTVKKTKELSEVNTYGKRKLDEILNPLRELEKEAAEKISDPIRTEEIAKEITKYGEDKTPNSPGQKLNAALTGDAQVQSYLGTLNTSEYATLREQVANWFGAEFGTKGAMGRNFENAYKTQRLKNLEANYRTVLGSQIDEMKSAGFLKGGDLTAIDTWESRMDDIVKIKNSTAYKSLDASTRQLDTVDKVDIALSKIDNTVEATKLAVRGNVSPETERTIRAQLEAKKINEVDLAKWREEADFIQNYDYTKLTRENAVAEYDVIKRNVGQSVADDIFRRDAIKEIQSIDQELAETGKAEEILFGKGLNKQENRVIDNIVNGKGVKDTDLEVIKNISDKITAEGWDKVKRALRKIDTLKTEDKLRIVGGEKNSKSIFGSTTSIVKGGMGAATIAVTFLYAIPQSLLWFGTSTPTNIAEMQGLYEQFKTGDENPQSLMEKILCEKCINDINSYLNHWNNLMDELPYSLFLSIPYYGDYIRAYIDTPMRSNMESINSNYKRMFIELKNLGLATEDSSALGFRATTEEEKEAFYSENRKALYGTKDADWIKKYSNGDETKLAPDGSTLDQATMEALYHYWKGDGTVDYATLNLLRGGLGDDAKEWKNSKGDKTFVDEILAWGDSKTSGTTTTATGAKTEAELEEIAVKNAMKRDGISEEAARRNLEIEITYLKEKGGTTRLAALEKITGIGGSSGGMAAATGTSSGEVSLPSDGEYGRSLLDKKRYSKLTTTEKEEVNAGFTDEETGELQYDKIKEKDSTVTMKEVAKSGEGTGFVKPYVEKNLNSMTADEVRDAADTDATETANAILEAACGGGS